jgi:hypothetical protein
MQEDVLRLDIPVDDPVSMRVVEGAGYLAEYPDRFADLEPSHAIHWVPERVAFHQWHGEPQDAGLVTRVVKGQDVRVREAGGQMDLAQEALATQRFRELRAKHLEGDLPNVPHIVGSVHGRHATGTNGRSNGVPSLEGSDEAIRSWVHGAGQYWLFKRLDRAATLAKKQGQLGGSS